MSDHSPGVPYPLLTADILARRYDLPTDDPAIRPLLDLAQRAQRNGAFTTIYDALCWLHDQPLCHTIVDRQAPPRRTQAD